MSLFEEFKKAYDSYPSQDNEGYVPDRAGFKAGFSSAWHIQEKRIADLKEEWVLADADAQQLERQNADLRTALADLVRLCDKDLLLDPEVWSKEEIRA